jgi:hypothetical protein
VLLMRKALLTATHRKRASSTIRRLQSRYLQRPQLQQRCPPHSSVRASNGPGTHLCLTEVQARHHVPPVIITVRHCLPCVQVAAKQTVQHTC